jgi:hypothetical protein
MILSGSLSSWIEENILRSTGFVGRVHPDLTLDELPLRHCAPFLQGGHEYLSESRYVLGRLPAANACPVLASFDYAEFIDPWGTLEIPPPMDTSSPTCCVTANLVFS